MRRLIWIASALACTLSAQPYLDLLEKPILDQEQRRSMMYSYVDRNLRPIEASASREQWEARKRLLRKEILEIVGLEDLESRGPLKWVSKGVLDRDGYTIEKILYESYPGMMVPALVYTPKSLAAPAPAMVSIPGHVYCEGKASEAAQARSVNLVRRGVIVLAYDYIGTFERNTGANPCAAMPYGGGNDHGLRGFSYTGKNPTGLEILDGIRAVDYLYARRDVDRNRLGFTGESGGSNSTYWVSALDERIRLAVPVCSVTSFDYWIRNNRDWDWHQRPSGIRRIAEISTLLAMFAPRPMLVIGSLRGTDSEEFPLDEMEKAVREARPTYDLYNSGANIRLRESSTSHGYQQDKREQMYAWVERHFFGKNGEMSAELPFTHETLTELRCGLPTGNKTLADIYDEWVNHLAPAPAMPVNPLSARQAQREMRGKFRRLLGVADKGREAVLSAQGVSSRGHFLLKRSLLETAPGLWLPAAEAGPRNAPAGGIVVILGKSRDLAPAVEALVSHGLAAFFLDVRGTGEISSGGGRTDNWAWFLGRPWPGMWSEDVSGTISAISKEYPNVPLGLAGIGRLGRTALFATALDERIAASLAYLDEVSYRDEAGKGGLADVPGILTAGDLPQVAALVAPRPLWIQFPDSTSEDQVRATYAWAADFYKRGFGTAQAFRTQRVQKTDWDSVASWFAEQFKTTRTSN